MSVTPGGSFEVRDHDGALQCFDATAAALYPWICRLIGGETAAGALLASVYLRLDEQVAAAGRVSVDTVRLEATAFALAAAVDDDTSISASSGVRSAVVDRALVVLAIEQRRDPVEIAAILGISVSDLDARLEDVRSRFGGASGRSSPTSGGGWLDDVTRSTAREAIERGRFSAPPMGSHGAAQLPRPRHGVTHDPPQVGDHGGPPRRRAPTRTRRAKVTALVAVTALLALGIWWSSSSDTGSSSSPDGTPLQLGASDTRGSISDSTEPPRTVRSSSTDTVNETGAVTGTTEPSTSVPYAGAPLHLSPGFLLGQTPESMQPNGLYESPADQNVQDMENADQWFQLWAEPEASRVSGRWLVISTVASSQNVGSLRAGWTRLAGDSFTGLSQVHADGVLDLDLRIRRPGDDIGVSISSFGIPQTELERVAASLVHFDSPTSTSNPRILPALLEPSPAVSDVMQGMELIGSGATWCCGITGPPTVPVDSRTVTYASIDDPQHGPWLSIQTSDGLTASPFDRFLIERSTDPVAPQNATSTVVVGDRVVHVAAASWFDGAGTTTSNTAWWVEDGRTISLSGTVDLGELLALVPTAHRATGGEWLQLNEQIALQPSVRYDDPLAGPTVRIGSVKMDDGSTWSLTLGAGAGSGELVMTGGASGEQSFGGLVSLNDGQAGVVEYDSVDATAVIVVLHDPVPEQAQVRVTVAGRPPSLVPLVHVDGTDVWAAFDAFVELPPYTVELVDAAGTSLQTLTH